MTTPLSQPQTIIAIILGLIFWFIAAMLVRTLGPMGALEGGWRVLTYALVIPGTVPAVWMTQRLAGLGAGQTATALLVVTATALFADGIAHAWFPWLYGSEPRLIILGAAVIFWGAGVGLVLGLIMDRKP
jgi:hypothetical protein